MLKLTDNDYKIIKINMFKKIEENIKNKTNIKKTENFTRDSHLYKK